MVYVFRKINNITGNGAGGDVISGATPQAGANVPSADPHASTYQNPDKVYQANIGENLGQLDTGLTKNINDTQNNLSKSSDAYKGNLNDIDSQYQYGGKSDLQNIGDSATFSRLSSLINPAGEQSQLNSVQSNTKNYNPDTQGLAQASTISGLSSQLQNQYGTSAGGSRLDAQLYRGSGQAGRAINNNLQQLDAFQTDKSNRLGQETNLLNQYDQGATDRSNQVKTEGGQYQTELQGQAADTAKKAQNTYDTSRQQAIDSLTQQRNSTDYQGQLRDAINQAFGARSVNQQFDNATQVGDISGALQRQGIPEGEANILAAQAKFTAANPTYLTGADGARTQVDAGRASGSLDLTDYLKNQIYGQFAPNINLNQFDPNQYVGGAKTFDANSYLDPRFNQLGQLLGTRQITGAGANQTSGDLTNNQAGFTKDINDYLAAQNGQAKNAVSSLFADNSGAPADQGNPYVAALSRVASNPAIFNAAYGLPSAGLAFTPLGDKARTALGNGVSNIGNQIAGGFHNIGASLGF